MRKWDDVTSEGLCSIIEYLKCNFDPELSLKVIELFHERMRDDEYVDPDLLYMLMKHVFASIMDGKSADQGFGLKAIKGKYDRPDTLSRDVHAAAIVVWKMRTGVSWECAVTIASEHLGIKDRTVERAYGTYRVVVESMPDEQLSLIADAPLLPP